MAAHEPDCNRSQHTNTARIEYGQRATKVRLRYGCHSNDSWTSNVRYCDSRVGERALGLRT
eukprot:7030459-Alexandrium_andersonii.AAC.1